MSVERERARPLLGTVTAVCVRAADEAAADRAIDAAFAAVARVHAAMSFQSPDSDLAAIGCAGAGATVAVSPDTRACLALALELAAESGGAFDPVLPGACWRDLAVTDAGVALARPLRVDLSGLAKGYAVDRACEALLAAGAAAGVVNAGGDLRVVGPAEENVALRPRGDAPPAAVQVADGARASSDVEDARLRHGGAVHRDGRTGAPAAAAFVAVAAPTCAVADGLTKVVLALGADAAPLLAARAATAWTHTGACGWRTLGAPA